MLSGKARRRGKQCHSHKMQLYSDDGHQLQLLELDEGDVSDVTGTIEYNMDYRRAENCIAERDSDHPDTDNHQHCTNQNTPRTTQDRCICGASDTPTTTDDCCQCGPSDIPTATDDDCQCGSSDTPTTTDDCQCGSSDTPTTTDDHCECGSSETSTTTDGPCQCGSSDTPTTTHDQCQCGSSDTPTTTRDRCQCGSSETFLPHSQCDRKCPETCIIEDSCDVGQGEMCICQSEPDNKNRQQASQQDGDEEADAADRPNTYLSDIDTSQTRPLKVHISCSNSDCSFDQLSCPSPASLTPPGASTQAARPISLNGDKYLIFTTGMRTYTPHQIGIKRIKSRDAQHKMNSSTVASVDQNEVPHIAGPGQELGGAVGIVHAQNEALDNVHDNINVAREDFDTVDHLIELHGHIIGMCLSPDHR